MARARSASRRTVRGKEARERVCEDRTRWLEENREAIAAYNARVDAHGTFGDEFGNI